MQVAQTGTSADQPPVKDGSSWHLWAKGSFSFHDVLDAVNPLQHLPIVSTIYREVTGDKIGNAARVAGDTLYGGVIGLAVGLVNAMSVSETGKDLGERAVAMVEGDSKDDTGSDAPPKGTVTVEPVASQTTPASGRPVSALNVAADDGKPPVPADTASLPKSISLEAALAALPNRPPVDLPYFPGGTAASAQMPLSRRPLDPAASTPTPMPAAQPAGLPLPTGSTPPVMTLNNSVHGIAIDTSSEGILAMRAKGHGQAAIPLQVSPGAFPTQSPPNSAAAAAAQAAISDQKNNAGNDFVIRMRQGIEKYNALLAKQNGTASSGSSTGNSNPGISGTGDGGTGNIRALMNVDTLPITGTRDAARLLN